MKNYYNRKGRNSSALKCVVCRSRAIFGSILLLTIILFCGLCFFTACKHPTGPRGKPGENGTDGINGIDGIDGINGEALPVVLFIFNANGGIFDTGGDLYIGQVSNNSITPPDISHPLPVFDLKGWYTKAQGGELFDFTGSLTSSRTLYAQWEKVFFTSTADVYDYLDACQGGNMPGDPVLLPVNIDLGDMMQSSNGWKTLLEEIGKAGKFVNLDLSPCGMDGTVFNPDSVFSTGKGLITALTLPQKAEEVQAGSWDKLPFTHFTSLTSFSAAELGSAGEYFFTGFPNLKVIELPNLSSIGNNAFASCTGLTGISFPLVDTIGDYAFYDCTGLQSINFPLAEEIGIDAFHGCTGLASVNFPRAKIIDDYAFSDSTRLQHINFPVAESIGDGVFWGCINISTARFPLAETIGDYAFSGCSELIEANFPLAADIGTEAFIFCIKLSDVYLPMAANIGNSAFYNCQKLSFITLGAVPPVLGDSAFLSTPMTGFTIKRPGASAAVYTQWLTDNSLKFYGGGSAVVFANWD